MKNGQNNNSESDTLSLRNSTIVQLFLLPHLYFFLNSTLFLYLLTREDFDIFLRYSQIGSLIVSIIIVVCTVYIILPDVKTWAETFQIGYKHKYIEKFVTISILILISYSIAYLVQITLLRGLGFDFAIYTDSESREYTLFPITTSDNDFDIVVMILYGLAFFNVTSYQILSIITLFLYLKYQRRDIQIQKDNSKQKIP